MVTADRYPRPAGVSDEVWAQQVLGIAEALCGLLLSLHERGVVHGGVGPDCVLIQSPIHQRAALVVAAAHGGPPAPPVDEPGSFRPPVVRLAPVPDQPLYPAPEVAAGRRATVRSDVYGFGCMLAGLLASVPEPDWVGLLTPSEHTRVSAALQELAREAMHEHPFARPYSFRVVTARLATIRQAWQADLVEAGAGAALLDAPRVPDELTAILGALSARLPEWALAWIPGWRQLAVEVGLPARRRAGLRGRSWQGRHTGSLAGPAEPVPRVVVPRPAAADQARSRARGRGVGWVWAAVIGVVVVLGGVAVWGAAAQHAARAQAAGASLAVPDLSGQSITEADAALGQAGLLEAGERTQADGKVPAGRVIGTDPAAGAHVAAQAPVILIVSTGPAMVAMPDVAGVSFQAASKTLIAAGFALGAVSAQDGPDPQGTVESTSPQAGTQTAEGTAVDVMIASGLQLVPTGLVSLDVNTATAQLKAAGFQVSTRTQATAEYVTGYVLQTYPAPGNRAPAGSAVVLTVAEYAAPTDTPTPTPLASTPSPSPSSSPAPTTSSTPNPGGASGTPTFIPEPNGSSAP